MIVSELEVNKALGTYTPSIFLIKLNTRDSIGYTLDSKNQKIFLHEYVHYLQDISTVYGHMNICNFFNTLKYGANQIYQKSDKNIHLPLSLSGNEFIEAASEAFRYIFGNTEELNNIKGTAVIKNNTKKINNVDLAYYYFEKDTNQHIIGAKDIMESMANAIQSKMYGETNPPFFPYKTVGYLIEIIAPQLGTDPIMISALCELSLNSSNPAVLLIDTLRKINENNLQIENIDDLKNIFYNDINYFDHNGKRISSILDLYDYSFNEAIKILLDTFNLPDMSELSDWISISYNNTKKLRKDDLLYITKGLLDDNPIDYYLNKILNLSGCPTIINNKFIPETIDHPHNTNKVVYLNLIGEFMNILFHGKKNCVFYSGCLEESKDNNSFITTDNCYESPWNKAKEKKLCPLAKLFHMWNISNVSYTMHKDK